MPQQAAFEDNRACDFAQKQVNGLPFTMLAVLPNGQTVWRPAWRSQQVCRSRERRILTCIGRLYRIQKAVSGIAQQSRFWYKKEIIAKKVHR